MKCAFALLFLCILAGCARTPVESVTETLEPTSEDRQVLNVEGIRDPYSPRGQKRLYKLARDRAELDRIRQAASGGKPATR